MGKQGKQFSCHNIVIYKRFAVIYSAVNCTENILHMYVSVHLCTYADCTSNRCYYSTYFSNLSLTLHSHLLLYSFLFQVLVYYFYLLLCVCFCMWLLLIFFWASVSPPKKTSVFPKGVVNVNHICWCNLCKHFILCVSFYIFSLVLSILINAVKVFHWLAHQLASCLL